MMETISTSAPANLKGWGDFSVTKGYPAVAFAIDIFAHAIVETLVEQKLEIRLPQLEVPVTQSFSMEVLDQIYLDFKNRSVDNDSAGLKAYISKTTDRYGLSKHILPLATVASILYKEHDVNVAGKRLGIVSDIPIQADFASSNATAGAAVGSLLRADRKTMTKAEEVVPLVRPADMVSHGSEGAGWVDTLPTVDAGMPFYDPKSGCRQLRVDYPVYLIAGDAGVKPSTREQVAKFNKKLGTYPDGGKAILEEMGNLTTEGAKALERHDLHSAGKAMYDYHAVRQGSDSEDEERGTHGLSLTSFIRASFS